MVQGVSHKEAAAAITKAPPPNTRTGGATRCPAMPAARMAVISPGLLFDELEVDQLQNPLQKPALVPPPDRAMAR